MHKVANVLAALPKRLHGDAEAALVTMVFHILPEPMPPHSNATTSRMIAPTAIASGHHDCWVVGGRAAVRVAARWRYSSSSISPSA
ncbi:MAG: hypothetical protein KY460_16635 [Actinobacteria bacterium]|nr:hypothetical protein [Actinomycetota bacterium]